MDLKDAWVQEDDCNWGGGGGGGALYVATCDVERTNIIMTQ